MSRQRTTRFVIGVLLSFSLAACASVSPPLYDGLGDSGRNVSTDSELAGSYWNQGLALSWGFNHDEALRAFEEMRRIDADSAMAWWGVAYVLGPNINRPMTDPRVARRAHRAAQKAASLQDGATEVERALIDAMTQRFTSPLPKDRKELDLAYANSMREAWQRFPNDPDVGTLFADALMNISLDWRDWGPDEERGEHTPEAIETLERVLELDPGHAGGNHFYIHAVEGSDRPERALVSAERLGGLMPAAGHMVHMPSHIYVRLGMYEEAVESNARAVERDDEFFAEAPRQGIYHLYRAHNHHFLAWAAMFQGSQARATDAARDMAAKLPAAISREFDPGLEAYLFVPIHVLMRFGLWEEILAEPQPEEKYRIATALWHHARAVAFANTKRIDSALAESEKFEKVAATVPESIKVRRAQIANLLEAARNMMNGEISFKQGEHDVAFALLRKGIEAEDSMPYAEPPGWMQPIRHSLGALLLEADRAEEAEIVFREDLARHAKNVWSLHGLTESLRLLGKHTEADQTQALFDEAARNADTEIWASCFCRSLD